jgi:uncharacterized protein YjbI with pentapeptide repeats
MSDLDHDLDHDEQVKLLLQGVEGWNQWRREHPDVQPNLHRAPLRRGRLQRATLGRAILERAILDGADLSHSDLGEANLRKASLVQANLTEANLTGADLTGADLSETILFNAKLPGAILTDVTLNNTHLRQADLRGVDFRKMDLHDINLNGARLSGAKLSGADLSHADLRAADLHDADLTGAILKSADLTLANLSGAILKDAQLPDAILLMANLTKTNLSKALLDRTDLTQAQLIRSNLSDAILIDCKVYGISTWDLSLDGATQTNLRITPDSDVEITADNLEVAQFLYLLLHYGKLRDVIDTITSKVVLILGNFSPERKRVLNALRDKLRQRNYLPVVFDFEGPKSRNTTQTVELLARMARFVIADLTEPRSIAHELAKITPRNRVPVQTLLLEDATTYAMFVDLMEECHWVLPPYIYTTIESLLAALPDHIIAPAEAKAAELQRSRTRLSDGLP